MIKTYGNADDSAQGSIAFWKLLIYVLMVLFLLLVHLIFIICTALLTTGIVFEWTIYFVMSTAVLLWTFINHIIAVGFICDSALVGRMRTYMIYSYCIQLALHLLLSLPIIGYYSSYPDARGLWIAVAYGGGFNWLLVALLFSVFYCLLVPTKERTVSGYVYVPVQQYARISVQ